MTKKKKLKNCKIIKIGDIFIYSTRHKIKLQEKQAKFFCQIILNIYLNEVLNNKVKNGSTLF